MGLMVDRICAAGRSSGQMTVEFVAALPVLIAVAAVSVNALTFFGWCAAFDNDFRDSVRVYAASPAYGQGTGDTCALIEQALDERLSADNFVGKRFGAWHLSRSYIVFGHVRVHAHVIRPGIEIGGDGGGDAEAVAYRGASGGLL